MTEKVKPKCRISYRSAVLFLGAGMFYGLCFLSIRNADEIAACIGLFGVLITNGMAWVSMFKGADE